jgi:hypothetical protein
MIKIFNGHSKNYIESIAKAFKKNLGLRYDKISLGEGINLLNSNFLSDLDFCLFLSKEEKK